MLVGTKDVSRSVVSSLIMIRLIENQHIDKYTVIYFIKESGFCSSYRVMGAGGKSFFMKLFDLEEMPVGLLSANEPQEITVCKSLNYENIVNYVDSGWITLERKDYAFLVTDFIVGDLLSDAMNYNGMLTLSDKLGIVSSIAKALDYMSSRGFIHNDICPRNLVLASNYKTIQLEPHVIDLGHASKENSHLFFPQDDLDSIYRAPETFEGRYSKSSDVFSLCVLLYRLLFNRNPWEEIVVSTGREDMVRTLTKARSAQVTYEIVDEAVPGSVITLIKKGLSEDITCRPTYAEIVACLTNGEPTSEESSICEMPQQDNNGADEDLSFQPVLQRNNTKSQGGFADVAGMEDLKKTLYEKVIWVLKNPSTAKEYRILPANGMLLYGPPGCGKTFFAQKFAEETGFKYMLVNGSDLGSTLVHGSQLKIRELFDKAQEEAPVVICFDEFDAFVPVRGAHGVEAQADEVNEFLSQLNNCSERRIFVIGTTNRKDRIDPAVLRKGRLDLHYLIPAPDLNTRVEMFKIHLKGRPLGEDIDYDALASLTDGYASSDIAYIVNEAALAAAMARELISQRHLVGSIKANASSLLFTQRPKIGF